MALTCEATPAAVAPEPHRENDRIFGSHERFISYHEVHRRTGLSRTTIWRLEKIKDFPQSVRISPGRRAWRESDLDKWIASRLESAE